MLNKHIFYIFKVLKYSFLEKRRQKEQKSTRKERIGKQKEQESTRKECMGRQKE